MNSQSKISLNLKRLLNFLLFIFGIILISYFISLRDGLLSYREFFVRFIGTGALFFAFFYLRKVILTVIEGEPFKYCNIKYFRFIGYALLLLTGAEFINSFRDFSGTRIFSIYPYFSFSHKFFIFLALALMAFVMAEIFKQALEIKKDNQLTI